MNEEEKNKSTKNILDEAIDSIKSKEQSSAENNSSEEATSENVSTEAHNKDINENSDEKFEISNDEEKTDSENIEGKVTLPKKLTALGILLSALIPGLGDFYVRKYKKGFLFFGITFILVLLFILVKNYSSSPHCSIYLSVVALFTFIVYFYNIKSAKDDSDRLNKENGFSKSSIKDSLSEYRILENFLLYFLE